MLSGKHSQTLFPASRNKFLFCVGYASRTVLYNKMRGIVVVERAIFRAHLTMAVPEIQLIQVLEPIPSLPLITLVFNHGVTAPRHATGPYRPDGLTLRHTFYTNPTCNGAPPNMKEYESYVAAVSELKKIIEDRCNRDNLHSSSYHTFTKKKKKLKLWLLMWVHITLTKTNEFKVD